MFNKIINTIYDSFVRPDSTKSKESNQTNNKALDLHRSSTVSDQRDLHSFFNTQSESTVERTSVSQSIPIGKANTSRRRTSVFGISNISCDDYIQKDLISSSWS